MKNKICYFLAIVPILFAACSNNAEPEEIPAAVKNAFEESYPNVEGEEWEKEGDDYEVEFEIDGIEQEIVYDTNGSVISNELEIEDEELPRSIIMYISETYPDYTIDDADMENEDGVIEYEVEIEKGDSELELVFDKDGNFLREEVDD